MVTLSGLFLITPGLLLQVTKQLKDQYNLPWLPEKQYEWYHTEVYCLDKAEKAEVVLPRLHDTLQRFAITFLRLQSFSLESHFDKSFLSRRNKIVKAMYDQIRKVSRNEPRRILKLEEILRFL